jgi:sortase A
MRASRPVLWLERLLALVGVVCLGWYGYISVDAAFFQREQSGAFERLLAETPPAPVAPTAPAAASVPAVPSTPSVPSASSIRSIPPASIAAAAPVKAPAAVRDLPDLIGILDIPRLRLSTPVVSGDDDKTLQVAVGHLPDTPRPWEPGNSAMAAHRDGLFRPLKNIRVGDSLRVRTTHGNLEYRVRDIKIVTPDDLSVLEQTPADTLTLITCYPFHYIGAAPKRFIVHAERIPD